MKPTHECGHEPPRRAQELRTVNAVRVSEETMKTLALTTTLTILLAACAGESHPTAAPSPAPVEAKNPGWTELGRGTDRFIRIDLGPDSFAECRRLSPKFPFDSAATYAQDREQIAALASCLNTPGMQERKVLLVGRADQRGTDAYNEELGMKRAKAIKQILIDNGLDANRIDVETEGKKGALGDKSEYSPGYDRRVDIVVEGGTHEP
jgi:OmpA-OmpF porin, OOP family